MVPVGISVYADWMPGHAGQATVYNAQPGVTYFVRVDNFYNETGTYQLDVTLPLDKEPKDHPFEDGAGNNLSWLAPTVAFTGNTLSLSGMSIHNTADQDWYRFVPTYNVTVQFTVTASMVSYDAGAPNGSISQNYTATVLHAWTPYYVKVSGNSDTTGLYTLGMVLTPAV